MMDETIIAGQNIVLAILARESPLGGTRDQVFGRGVLVLGGSQLPPLDFELLRLRCLVHFCHDAVGRGVPRSRKIFAKALQTLRNPDGLEELVRKNRCGFFVVQFRALLLKFLQDILHLQELLATRPQLRIGLEALLDKSLEVARVFFRYRIKLTLLNFFEERVHIIGVEWWSLTDHLVDDAPQTPDVTL